MSNKKNIYSSIIERIFFNHYKASKIEIQFERDELIRTAADLGISAPKNLGDVVYSFRYRNPLPESVSVTAKAGHEWIIEGAGIGKYVIRQVKLSKIEPRENLLTIKIPDSTPEIIATYAQSDEQALLARIRYNRLIDIFLGITTYSLQNHLRTTVDEVGQIEIDELYVGLDKRGVQYIIPVQAKSGRDRNSVVQTKQDIACCKAKFPNLECKPISAQFLNDKTIVMFEFLLVKSEIKIVQESHYLLVPSDSIEDNDLESYKKLKLN